MQTNRRLIQDVKHTAQIRTKLRGQTNPLRFAAAQGFRRTPERQISESDVFHKAQPLPNFGQQLRCDRLVRAPKSQLVNFPRCFAGRKRSEIVDGTTLHPHMARDFDSGVNRTAWALPRFVFTDPFRFTLGRELIFQSRFAIVALA